MNPEGNARLAVVLDEYLKAVEAGHAPDRGEIVARHPDLAEELSTAFLSLDFVRGAAPSLSGDRADAVESLGDYRLVRELGRGGMAVVYEAEQVSLGRRVALKVLPFAAVLDPKQLQRFKNEAMAAAHLRHPNIVPVYGVGCERGIHYYAMQYVEGQSLAAAIGDMRRRGGLRSSDDGRPASGGEGARTPISSHGSNREPGYIRMVAAIGVQAAEALGHAHELGVVHRDVKPANLLVDAAGTLWITDFGLARSVRDVGLTMTGELLGTVRYMSPEQALAKRAPVDHRTDVYSLGATLYELFTLDPAFTGDDPHVVIQDILTREPAPPRRLNPALPMDLETVLLKAMAKDAAGRYATAHDMAEDLRRCLEDKPILARRPSIAARAGRWARRHRTVVAAALAALVLGIAGLAAAGIRVAHEQRRTKGALDASNANLRLARDAVDRFLVETGLADLSDGPLPPPSRHALLLSALRFYGAFADDPRSLMNRATILHGLRRYEEALGTMDRLAAMLPDDVGVGIWRAHMLTHVGRSVEALAVLDRVAGTHADVCDVHYQRGVALARLERFEDALLAHERAIALDPKQPKIHAARGNVLVPLGRHTDAVAASDAALAIDRYNSEAHQCRGNALSSLGLFQDALAAYDRAIEIEPDFPAGHVGRGDALLALRRFEDALAAHERAISLDPECAPAHMGRGNVLQALGRLDGALEAFERVLALAPGRPEAHYNLGCILYARGDLDGAMSRFREAIAMRPLYAKAHCNLGLALARQGRFREAAASLRTGHELASRLPHWTSPSKAWLEDAERKAAIEERIVAGDAPKSALESIDFAGVLYVTGRHGDSARHYAEAFAADAGLAEDLGNGHRYNAACCAALAAARGEAEAAGWRGRALEWLRADLAAREKAGLAAQLDHWKRDPDLAAVRDRLDALPADERQAWTDLWTAVDAILARTRAAPQEPPVTAR